MTRPDTTIDIAIATCRPEGIRRLAECSLPELPGVRYVVSWQNHDEAPVPDILRRPDVDIVRFDAVGQSLNRNNSIACCRADVVVIADDDLRFFPEGISELQQAYSEHPEVDLIITNAIKEGECRSIEAQRLKHPLPKDFFVGAVEISFRRHTRLLFCPDLGLNSPVGLDGGEDEILFATALGRGLECLYIPVTIVEHDHPSTGSKPRMTTGNLRACGCVIALTHPWWQTILRLPLKIYRLWRGGRATLAAAIRYVVAGALAAPGVRRRNRSYLW